jgi:hypothetical protein
MVFDVGPLELYISFAISLLDVIPKIVDVVVLTIERQTEKRLQQSCDSPMPTILLPS